MSEHSDALSSPVPQPAGADWDAISRHLAGESDAVESAAVEAWLAAHPEDAALVEIVKARADRTSARAAVTVDTERALAMVSARLRADGANVVAPLRVERGGAARTGTAAPTAARGGGRWRTIGFAAAAGLVAVAALSVFRDRASDVSTATEYQTAVGQRDSVQLPDGSTVVLAPGSRLTVAASFAGGAREVTLDGAAYFDVHHDDARPFTVHAAGADIRDIGTAFSVKTTRDGQVSVAVTHGIVALSAASAGSAAPVELHAGDRGTVAKQTVTVRRGVVTDDDVAWTRGLLSYRDATLSEVRADLQRWYGIELRVPDSVLASRTLTASFRGDSAAQVIQVIALALGAEAVQRGDTVVLQPQGTGLRPTP